MLSWIYWAIVAYFTGLTIYTLYREKRLLMQLSCALVLMTLLLRLLGIK